MMLETKNMTLFLLMLPSHNPLCQPQTDLKRSSRDTLPVSSSLAVAVKSSTSVEYWKIGKLDAGLDMMYD